MQTANLVVGRCRVARAFGRTSLVLLLAVVCLLAAGLDEASARVKKRQSCGGLIDDVMTAKSGEEIRAALLSPDAIPRMRGGAPRKADVTRSAEIQRDCCLALVDKVTTSPLVAKEERDLFIGVSWQLCSGWNVHIVVIDAGWWWESLRKAGVHLRVAADTGRPAVINRLIGYYLTAMLMRDTKTDVSDSLNPTADDIVTWLESEAAAGHWPAYFALMRVYSVGFAGEQNSEKVAQYLAEYMDRIEAIGM